MKVSLQGCKAVLYLADNREVGDIVADAVVTDPPYGIKYKGGKIAKNSISRTGKRFSRTIVGDDVPFDPRAWLDRKCVAFTGAQHFYESLPPGGMLHCWDKRGNYKALTQADADVIWVKGMRKRNARPRLLHLAWRGICRHAENSDRILHPTQKPVALMEWIIGMLDLPSDAIIFDPFMGVGTTGVAALNLGMRFVGIESEKEYFDHAVRRMSDPLLRFGEAADRC